MMIVPAKRIEQVEEYYFSKKLKEIAVFKEQGVSVLNLGIGSPDLPPSQDTIDALIDAVKSPSVHGYQSYVGIPELREGFAKWYARFYGVTLNPSNEILPLMGSKEGILHICMAFVNAGEEILVPNPGYPTYQSVANLVQAKTRLYSLDEHNQWQPNFDELEQQDLSKVKLMWVNYPNMPTGARASLALFERLIAFGKKHQILICNDNPYSFILHNEHLSILQVQGAKDIALELNSLSKSHHMAGWRMGMLAGSPTYLDYVVRVKSNMDSGMFKPLQLAAVKALESDESWFAQLNTVYTSRRELVFAIFDALGCIYDKHQGGLFVWAKIPASYQSAEELTDKLLHQCHVFITPGSIFGSNGNRYVRIALCSTELILKEALDKVKRLAL